ncbi:MAG: tetratricopeptide repeat protein [Anaeromyxobacteraceae bacterium]
MASLGDLVADLRRRKVFRALAAWGVIAFALLQVFEPIQHGLHLPDWTLTLVVVLVAAGFPVTVALAWVFDLGPGGVVRTAPGPVDASAAPAGPGGLRGWRLGGVLGVLGLLAAAPGLAWYFGWRLPARGGGRAEAGGAPTLAVLPLANLSGDASQAYFSDGMTEEITTKLSQLRGLAVTAASSVARYRDAPADPRRIGEELGVAFVLEGSVRRAGDRVRVSARLVKTADGFRVWSDDIDSSFDDIFAVQERVATRIVEALGVHLEPGESRRLTDWGTRNAAAYDAYLRGTALAVHFDDLARLEAGRRQFEAALALDPDFAPALAGIANVELQTFRNFETEPGHLTRAEEALRRALALDPRLTYARIFQGGLQANRFEYEAAARTLRPVTADEPRNHVAWDQLCWVLTYQEPPEAEEAERACRRALALDPGYVEANYHLARALVFQRRFDEAEQAIRRVEEGGSERLGQLGRFWLALVSGHPREALDHARERMVSRRTSLAPAWEAMAHAQLGEKDPAFTALDEALRRGYRDVPSLRRSPWLAPLRDDPRFEPLLARHGIGR